MVCVYGDAVGFVSSFYMFMLSANVALTISKFYPGFSIEQ